MKNWSWWLLLLLAGCGGPVAESRPEVRSADRPPRFSDAGLGSTEPDVSPYQEWNVSGTERRSGGTGGALFFTAACAVADGNKWKKYEIKPAASSAWLGELNRLLTEPMPEKTGWKEVVIFVASRQQIGFRNDVPYRLQHFDGVLVETKKLNMRVSGSFWQLHLLVKTDRPLSQLLLQVPYHGGGIRSASEFPIKNGKLEFVESRFCSGANSTAVNGNVKLDFEFPKSTSTVSYEVEVVSNDITNGFIFKGQNGAISGTIDADKWPKEGLFRLSNTPIPTADIGPFKIL